MILSNGNEANSVPEIQVRFSSDTARWIREHRGVSDSWVESVARSIIEEDKQKIDGIRYEFWARKRVKENWKSILFRIEENAIDYGNGRKIIERVVLMLHMESHDLTA